MKNGKKLALIIFIAGFIALTILSIKAHMIVLAVGSLIVTIIGLMVYFVNPDKYVTRRRCPHCGTLNATFGDERKTYCNECKKWY